MDGRKFPSVSGEEEMNGVVVELGFGTQIGVDHLSDRCRPVWLCAHIARMCDPSCTITIGDRDTTIVVGGRRGEGGRDEEQKQKQGVRTTVKETWHGKRRAKEEGGTLTREFDEHGFGRGS